MRPENGVMPQDGTHVSSQDTGKARLQDPQDSERAGRASDSPAVKFRRVWSEEYRGSSGTQSLRGR